MPRILFKKIAVVITSSLCLLIAASPSTAQDKSTAQNGTAKKAASTTTSEHGGGAQEGIKVHGHWVIEVFNRNGTLASRREFENALIGNGKVALAKLLSRTGSAGRWEVLFDSETAGDGGCGAQKQCIIAEGSPSDTFSDTVVVGTDLAATPMPANTPFPAMIQLKGMGTATSTGIISRVSTRLSICSNTTAPAAPCPLDEGIALLFTEARVGPNSFQATNVVAGQVVQVTVTFSFS